MPGMVCRVATSTNWCHCCCVKFAGCVTVVTCSVEHIVHSLDHAVLQLVIGVLTLYAFATRTLMHCMRGLARLPVAGVLVPAVASRSRANAAMQPQQRGVASAARQRNVYIVPRDGGQPRKLCSARRAAHGASAVPLVAQQQRVARFAGLTPDDFR